MVFELESPTDMIQIGADLKRQGIKIIRGPGVHVKDMTYHVYIEDPDGDVIELMARTSAKHIELRATVE